MSDSTPAEEGRAPVEPTFRIVDDGDAPHLVAMMDATDAWPAVQAAREWVLDRAALRAGALVVDVGSGPGTFGALARGRAAWTVDAERSAAMIGALVARHRDAAVTRADLATLPFRSGVADLVHIERVLQWSDDPAEALAELRRVVSPGGVLAVTDTDWGTFGVDHPDPESAARLSAAALTWVPHPTFARSVPHLLIDASGASPVVRTDTVVIAAWDPDDAAQLDGPLGLPLRTMAAVAPSSAERAALTADLDALADLARHGRFHATLTLVTTVVHC